MKADKKLGQHFLVDQVVIKRIVADYFSQSEAVVEIGPGLGALTTQLKLHHNFWAIEKDLRFKEELAKEISPEQIIWGDILEIDLEELFKKLNIIDKKIWVVSNLPYNISTPLLIKLLPISAIRFMTLMFQKEVGEKIVATSDMNSLRALSENFFDIKKLISVSAKSFKPSPQVDSIVLSFVRKNNPIINYLELKEFEHFLRRLFSQRRKQLGTVLKSYYSDQLLLKTNIDRKLRSSNLSMENIYFLFQEIRKL